MQQYGKSLLSQEKGKNRIPDSLTDPKMGTGQIKRCTIIVQSSNYRMQMAMETASVAQ